MYYAHSTDRQDKSDWQTLKDHLENVADIAKGFSKDFNAEQLGYAAGLLHDIGKYSPEFQQRLTGINIKANHSTAGAQECGNLYDKAQSLILEYVITGHHGGLLNFENTDGTDSNLRKRISQKQLPNYSAYKSEILAPDLIGFRPHLKPFHDRQGFAVSFYIRMLFSCLVDADFLDTENVLKPDKSVLRGKYESFETLFKKFDNHMNGVLLEAEEAGNNNLKAENSKLINRYRREIYEQCREKASSQQQMFSLTVPTGGGKTLSSMAFALDHLKKHNLSRIFYIIPYTSIIEQNADVFRKNFGAQNVLEHHSNYDPRNEELENKDSENAHNIEEKLKLSAENWDMPIVVTTNVQFFKSMFSNRVSRCRKLHNLSNSVIILDEAQMLPTGFLKPCLAALSELVANYGSTVVICTATKPNLDGLLDKCVKPVEIMQSPEKLYEIFRRVHVTDIGDSSDTDLSTRLAAHKQVLCIVNTRRHTLNLYNLLPESKSTYHLSARMCPVHRRKILNEIKARLDTGSDCRVVSTSLIGVGVNIDFPAVYEGKCGIDSACQGAGRCNREGKLVNREEKLVYGEVYVFRSTEEFKMVPWQRRVAEIGSKIFDEYRDDPLSIPAVDQYFKELYFYEGDGLDKERILPALEECCNKFEFPFKDVADAFKLIKDNTQSIIIPYDNNARSLLKKLLRTGFPGSYIRSLQGYTVNIYFNEFETLTKSNAITCIADRFFVLKEGSDYYSENVGLLNQSTSRAQATEFLYLSS